MNLIFAIIFIFSASFLSLRNPNLVIKAMSDGASKSITLSLSLASIYTIWSGVLQIAEDSGLVDKLSNLLKPIINRLFKNIDEKVSGNIAVNVSANLLGMGGIATPSGIEATSLLTEKSNHDGACLLFVLTATSLQILPTTVVSLRQTFASASPFDIFLPSLISSAVATGVGILLCLITNRTKK